MEQDIPYIITRSVFLRPCEEAIRQHQGDLNAGRTVRVTFRRPRPGYSGAVQVEINSNDASYFGSDWRGNLDRLSVRIRAAATALYRCGYRGRFEITHDAGLLQIRRLSGAVRNQTAASTSTN